MLARALGLEEQATTSGLPADGGMWSAGYINALTDRGYVSGTSVNGVLAVNARSAITRASAMKLLDQAIPADKAEEEPAPVVAAHTSGAGGGSTSTSTTTTTTTKHEENEPYALRTIQQIFADAAKEDAGKNIAYSPANLYLALCMLAETAGGDSRAQLLDLLEVSSVEEARATAKALWDELYKNDDEGKTLLANSLWMNEQSTFHENTTDILKNDHRAEAFREPMGVKATDEKIEDWISEKTEHMLNLKIKTNPFTLMMLVSALYFKGSWEDAFNKALTHEDVFTSVKGEEQRIDFMHRTETDSFYHGNGFTAASLPFKDTTKMWFLLPDEGTDISMDALARVATLLNSGDGELERGIIEWSVPKFDIERSLNLNATMKALGVTDIFDSYLADFSPLTDQDMVIDLIRHAVRVKVDEEGAEAAAVTIIEGNTTSGAPIPLPVIEMDLDRPFGFLITGTDDLPLFVGVVNTVVEEN
ncbi:MAG: hypothetical protein IJT71_02160, partial [Oscillospiraceae bacterium]|nr:hypothetical protein [Oscillospiraceae bacterium]